MNFFRGVGFGLLGSALIVGIIWGAMWFSYNVIAPAVFGPIQGR